MKTMKLILTSHTNLHCGVTMQPTFMPRATQSLTSLWNGIVLCLAFLTVFSTAHAQTPKAAPLTIKPETAYRLAFDATGQKENDSWWVHMQDGQGDMRYEGAVQDDWQKLVPGEKSYIHLFYSPADASAFAG